MCGSCRSVFAEHMTAAPYRKLTESAAPQWLQIVRQIGQVDRTAAADLASD
jgi:hypothetical protein